jgi:hypothetical protein
VLLIGATVLDKKFRAYDKTTEVDVGNSTALLSECYLLPMKFPDGSTLSSPRADSAIRVLPAAECTWLSP